MNIIWCEWPPLFSSVWSTVSTMPFEWWEFLLASPLWSLDDSFSMSVWRGNVFFLSSQNLFSSKNGPQVPSLLDSSSLSRGFRQFITEDQKNEEFWIYYKDDFTDDFSLCTPTSSTHSMHLEYCWSNHMTRTTNWKNASSKYILREKDSLLANCDSHPLAGELLWHVCWV